MSCPYTSSHNGKVEHTLYTINNQICSLLFHTSMLAHYWVEGLHTVTYLLNRPLAKRSTSPSYMSLFTVSHPHMSTCTCSTVFVIPTFSYKLPTNCPPPPSTYCVFLRYSAYHKGYRCLDISTNNIIVSQHVVFDEVPFPFATPPCLTNDLEIFL
jgi:hypothetical protein